MKYEDKDKHLRDMSLEHTSFCKYCTGKFNYKQCECCDAMTGDCFVGVDSDKKCSKCEWWGKDVVLWNGKHRPCKVDQEDHAEFCVEGGDCNDALYTEPDFWCKHFKEK